MTLTELGPDRHPRATCRSQNGKAADSLLDADAICQPRCQPAIYAVRKDERVASLACQPLPPVRSQERKGMRPLYYSTARAGRLPRRCAPHRRTPQGPDAPGEAVERKDGSVHAVAAALKRTTG